MYGLSVTRVTVNGSSDAEMTWSCSSRLVLVASAIHNARIFLSGGNVTVANTIVRNSLVRAELGSSVDWTLLNITDSSFANSSALIASGNVSLARRNSFEGGYYSHGVELAVLIAVQKNFQRNLVSIATSSIDARGNWWGASSGPSSCCNPAGEGSPLLWMTDYSPWCTVRFAIVRFRRF